MGRAERSPGGPAPSALTGKVDAHLPGGVRHGRLRRPFRLVPAQGIEAGAPGGGRAETTAMSASSRLYLEAGRDLCVLVVAKKERACVG